jgi:hypothetical protein
MAVVIGVGVTGWRACLSQQDPDQRLAGRLDAMCEIAGDNVETPERGVRQLGGYLAAHFGDMNGELGDTIALIETIPDDGEHDARARTARDRIRAPLRACERTWQRFGQAVSEDPEASRLVERAAERYSRTIEIIFSGKRLDFGDLPRELMDALARP